MFNALAVAALDECGNTFSADRRASERCASEDDSVRVLPCAARGRRGGSGGAALERVSSSVCHVCFSICPSVPPIVPPIVPPVVSPYSMVWVYDCVAVIVVTAIVWRSQDYTTDCLRSGGGRSSGGGGNGSFSCSTRGTIPRSVIYCVARLIEHYWTARASAGGIGASIMVRILTGLGGRAGGCVWGCCSVRNGLWTTESSSSFGECGW